MANYTLLGGQDSSWSIAWERSSPDWGGVGESVHPRLQWSAHDAMWCPVSSPPPRSPVADPLKHCSVSPDGLSRTPVDDESTH